MNLWPLIAWTQLCFFPPLAWATDVWITESYPCSPIQVSWICLSKVSSRSPQKKVLQPFVLRKLLIHGLVHSVICNCMPGFIVEAFHFLPTSFASAGVLACLNLSTDHTSLKCLAFKYIKYCLLLWNTKPSALGRVVVAQTWVFSEEISYTLNSGCKDSFWFRLFHFYWVDIFCIVFFSS